MGNMVLELPVPLSLTLTPLIEELEGTRWFLEELEGTRGAGLNPTPPLTAWVPLAATADPSLKS